MATGYESRVPALQNGQGKSGQEGKSSQEDGRRRIGARERQGLADPASSLDDLISGEIIPRLLMAHRNECAHSAGCIGTKVSQNCSIDCAEATRFAALPLEMEADELLREVETILDRGVGVETIFVELLAPSARRLGQLWEDDSCDFVDVTMGLWRLQEVMREITRRSPAARRLTASPTALFAPMPGDQHSFGSLMVEEVFARAGWQSEVLFEPKRRELLNIIAEKPFDLVGLTISNDCPSGSIAELISAIRSVSREPAVRVIIGGRVVNADPDLSIQVGADGTAIDARSALALAEKLVTGEIASVDCL